MTNTSTHVPGNCTAAIIDHLIEYYLTDLPEGQHVTLDTASGRLDAVRNGTYVSIFPLGASGLRGDTGRKRGHQGVAFHTFNDTDARHALGVVLNRARRMGNV